MNKIIDGCVWDREIDKWVPEEDCKDRLTVYCKDTAPKTAGTYKVDTLMGPNYSQLVNFLGDPTFPNESSDGKVQKEWVVEFNDELFTIYDWKTYSAYETKNTLDSWSVGGTSYAGDFIDYIKVQIDKMELPF